MLADAARRNVVHVDRPEDLPLPELGEMLERDSVAFVRGLIDPAAVLRARERLAAAFDPARDRPGTGETPAELMDNFQKLSIGGAPQSGVYRPRFFRTLYNPVWAEDVYGLRDVFRQAARMRNVLYGLPVGFAVDDVEDGWWTAARVHHYPAGGGFLVSHCDTVVPRVHHENGLGMYYQPIVVLSRKGEHFTEGGGFVERDGERLYYEAACELGDIAIYDGRTRHGVDDVDPRAVYRPDSMAGRIAGFVTLYRDLRERAAA